MFCVNTGTTHNKWGRFKGYEGIRIKFPKFQNGVSHFKYER